MSATNDRDVWPSVTWQSSSTPSENFDVTDLTAACYVRGTRILTVEGEVAIESIQPGDRVVTLLGRGAVFKPVIWVGRRRLNLALAGQPERGWPVRIRAGALAEGVPVRDLVVSPDHGLYLAGRLVQADTLVNGASIVQEARGEVEYFHLELAEHDIIVAEGAPAESYLDAGQRADFDNGRVTTLRPAFRNAENAVESCVPVVRDGQPWVEAVAPLIARCGALGFAISGDPAVLLVVAGRVLPPRREGNRYSFDIPADSGDVWLCSRASRPAAVLAGSDDRRWLGLGVSEAVYEAGDFRQEIPLSAFGPLGGFYDTEMVDGCLWRWSDGRGSLPGPSGAGLGSFVTLTVTVMHTLPYWTVPAAPAGAGREPALRQTS